MPKRTFIPMSLINKVHSSLKAAEKKEEVNLLLQWENNLQKNFKPMYFLKNVQFNLETRITKIEFLETQQYRTIDKYVTQNYVKHPIYSNVKTKKKSIIKHLKLTNSELEKLNNNDDWLIRRFATEIIISLKSEDLQPSWFIEYLLSKECEDKINVEKEKHNKLAESSNNKIKSIENKNKELKVKITSFSVTLNSFYPIQNNLENKIKKIKSSKKTIFKSIFTFFIYNIFVSKRRIASLEKKLSTITSKINIFKKNIENCKNEILQNENGIEELKNKVQKSSLALVEFKNLEYSLLEEKKSTISILPFDATTNNEFIPLKNFSGLTYKKIIGCYIIHNKENDKYYVGQSKDVYKRIKQHFNGTEPKNIIFAEDYYLSKFEKKEDLFEIKILQCTTKDELDKTEKENIEFYNSFSCGYNGTNGNL